VVIATRARSGKLYTGRAPVLHGLPRYGRNGVQATDSRVANILTPDRHRRTRRAGRPRARRPHCVAWQAYWRERSKAVEDILRVGTSAGGARAKAVLAWNEATGEFRSGQAPAAQGFSHWLLKFDGVSGNRDKELADPQGFGRIEYAYYRMALAARIDMEPSRLHEEGGRAHFMTRRFDRVPDGGKLHMLSLGALAHYDFALAGAYAYEQVLQTMRKLGMPMQDVEQQVRRTYFNVLARNQDDHVKNIAFLMDRGGVWRLSPALDMSYSWNPSGAWTSVHQMTVGSKRDGFEIEDLITFASVAGLKKRKAMDMLAEASAAVSAWQVYAEEAGVSEYDAERIALGHRVSLFIT